MTHVDGCIDQALITCAHKTVGALRQAGRTVVTAESCTAGLISAALSQVDGAGEILHGSFVTYSKASKAMALGVDAALLERDGSVNAEVVRQLVFGALARSSADIALAVSGVLGPSSDEDGNPVGLVYFGCGHRGGAIAVTCRNYGDQPHDMLRRHVVMEGLDLLSRSAAAP